MRKNVHEMFMKRYICHYFLICYTSSYITIFSFQEDLDNKNVIRKKDGEAWKTLFYLHDLCDIKRKLHSKYRHWPACICQSVTPTVNTEGHFTNIKDKRGYIIYEPSQLLTSFMKANNSAIVHLIKNVMQN